MGRAWIAIGVVLVTLVAGTMGYTIASAVLTFKALGFSADIDFGHITQNYLWCPYRLAILWGCHSGASIGGHRKHPRPDRDKTRRGDSRDGLQAFHSYRAGNDPKSRY